MVKNQLPRIFASPQRGNLPVSISPRTLGGNAAERRHYQANDAACFDWSRPRL